MCELLIFLSIYWRLILFYFIFAPSSHPFPWQSHLCNSSHHQEFYMFVPFWLLRLWHRGVGTGTALHLPGWGYGLFVVLTPVRVLSMANQKVKLPCGFDPRDPVCFFLLFTSLAWRVWLRVRSFTVQPHPYPALSLPRFLLSTGCQGATFCVTSLTPWNPCKFTVSHLSPTGIFTAVSSLGFRHLSTVPLYGTQWRSALDYPWFPKKTIPHPYRRKMVLMPPICCLGQNTTSLGHRNIFLENN